MIPVCIIFQTTQETPDKRLMSCVTCRSAVKAEHFARGMDECNRVKQEFRRRTVVTLSRLSAECQHGAFCWVAPLAFHLYFTFSFEQNTKRSHPFLHRENCFLFHAQLQFVWVHCDQASLWMEEELRLGNAGAFIDKLTEHFGDSCPQSSTSPPAFFSQHVKSFTEVYLENILGRYALWLTKELMWSVEISGWCVNAHFVLSKHVKHHAVR